jgi:nickel transport protein
MKLAKLAMSVAVLVLIASPAWAHFGMIIPDRNLVGKSDPKVINLQLMFWHPMENHGMNLAKPQAAGVMLEGKKRDLTGQLKPAQLRGKQIWTLSLPIRRPGDYIFYMTPQPYWEAAEDCFIIHYTKTVVDALGYEEGWDRPVGTKIEIIPLSRPYGLWAGNSFTGKVLYKGKPLAGTAVEVEFFNPQGKHHAPADAYVTQVVNTDQNGVFTYAMPWGGWWGFAALTTDDAKLKKDGKDKSVEVGGVIWVYAHPVGK